jgi:putative membrane protein
MFTLRAYRIELFHAFFRTAILFIIPLYISNLIKTGHIEYYIAPRMLTYQTWAVIAFFLVALYQCHLFLSLLFNKSSASKCDCEHALPTSLFKSICIYFLFVLPFALGIFLPNSILGSSMVTQRGINLSGNNMISNLTPNELVLAQKDLTKYPVDEAIAKKFPIKIIPSYAQFGIHLYQQPLIQVTDKRYMETLTTLNLYSDNFIGKKIHIAGFVYQDEHTSKNQFILGRVSITCCTADSVPFGVIVEDPKAATFPLDSWLSISGTLEKTTYQNQDIIMIKPDTIEEIPKPKTGFYVYNDPDFYKNP